MPEAFITTHDAWEDYIADIWHHLLGHYGIGFRDTIIEIAPGTSSKIGLALKKTSFEGTIFLIDPLDCSLKAVVEKYKRYLPNAKICPINTTLVNALSSLPKEADFLLSNHPLDDMLLASVTRDITPDLFACSSKMHRDNRLLLESEPTQAISFVTHCWQSALNSLLPKSTILCQYPSLILKQNHIHTLNKYAEQVMENLKSYYREMLEPPQTLQQLLNAHENFNDEHIGTEVLNAKNWMVVRHS